MKIVLSVAAILAVTAIPASADCALSSGPCSTDSRGNTYRTHQNLGGGYTTERNGSAYSTTRQNLGGDYTESFSGGGSRSYNHDPYRSGFQSPYGSGRNR